MREYAPGNVLERMREYSSVLERMCEYSGAVAYRGRNGIDECLELLPFWPLFVRFGGGGLTTSRSTASNGMHTMEMRLERKREGRRRGDPGRVL